MVHSPFTKIGTARTLTLHAPLKAEEYLETAMDALATGDVCHSLLDRLPVPIYTTDATAPSPTGTAPVSNLPGASRSSAKTDGA